MLVLSILVHVIMRNMGMESKNKRLMLPFCVLAVMACIGISLGYFYQAGAMASVVDLSSYNGYLGLAY